MLPFDYENALKKCLLNQTLYFSKHVFNLNNVYATKYDLMPVFLSFIFCYCFSFSVGQLCAVQVVLSFFMELMYVLFSFFTTLVYVVSFLLFYHPHLCQYVFLFLVPLPKQTKKMKNACKLCRNFDHLCVTDSQLLLHLLFVYVSDSQSAIAINIVKHSDLYVFTRVIIFKPFLVCFFYIFFSM